MFAAVFREPGEEMLYGYDWAFAPFRATDPEYRQADAERQLRWLSNWMPRPEAVH